MQDMTEYFEAIRDLGWEVVLQKLGLSMHYCPRGVGYGIMKCVFHKEKTASLVFYRRGSYHCFACGKSGDIFNFVERLFRRSRRRAHRFFKKEFNMSLPQSRRS